MKTPPQPRSAAERALLDLMERNQGSIERWLLDPTEVQIANRLIKRGIVERGHLPEDARLTIYHITRRASR